MKQKQPQYIESNFRYPLFGILAFSVGIWFMWFTVNTAPQKTRIQNTTKFFFSNIPFKERDSYARPLLFAKPSAKGFAANYNNLNLKEKSNIEFLEDQKPIFESIETETLRAKTPAVDNTIKKTIIPNLLYDNHKRSSLKPEHLELSMSKNLKKLNLTIDMSTPALQNMPNNKYAICSIQLGSNGLLEHIFFDKTNLSKDERFILNRVIQTAKFDTPEEQANGQIKIFIKNTK
ncbi:MAG: hypothetical protein PF692_08305 [Kiritimatiellae bacterium]|jgi:hypothetical protein|nr:hypothetical protein [Kiritimatiellia bacterium]